MEKELEKHLEGQPLNKTGEKLQVKPFKRRWWIIFLFMYYSGVNYIQWVEYSSITPLVVKYYNVSSLAVDWTSTIFMAIYPILIIPASYLINKKGMRLATVIGCSGTFLGTSLKVLSIRNDLFWVALLGNTILAASSMMIMSLPPKLATIWFKANEVSTACSLGVFGTQMGIAIGFILSPFIVQDSNNVEEIGSNLQVLCWGLAISMIPVTIAVLVYFPDEPPLPPNNIQALLRQNKTEFDTKLLTVAIKDLFLNKGFVMHLLAYGLNGAVFTSVGTLLTQMVLAFFQGANREAGLMGFILMITGLIGMVAFGIILDKTHKYKEIALLNYLISALSVALLLLGLRYQIKSLTYIACILLGLSTNSNLMVGFEFGMELTFPAEESTTTGILVTSYQIMGAVLTVFLGYMNIYIGTIWVLITLILLLIIGTVLTLYVPNRYLRQEAFEKGIAEYSIRKASYHGSRPLIFL